MSILRQNISSLLAGPPQVPRELTLPSPIPVAASVVPALVSGTMPSGPPPKTAGHLGDARRLQLQFALPSLTATARWSVTALAVSPLLSRAWLARQLAMAASACVDLLPSHT